MKYRVILKANGRYYPQYKLWIIWRNFTEPYYEWYETFSFYEEANAISHIEQHCQQDAINKSKALKAAQYIPKEITCQ